MKLAFLILILFTETAWANDIFIPPKHPPSYPWWMPTQEQHDANIRLMELKRKGLLLQPPSTFTPLKSGN